MSNTAELVTEAKIAKIVSPTVLAITAGSEKEVKVGDNAIVYRLEEIYDPDSEELIQTLVMTRLRLRITSVFSKVSLAEVTDRVSHTTTRDVFLSRPLRQVTYESPVDKSWLRVTRGEAVRVMRPPPEPEEPPF